MQLLRNRALGALIALALTAGAVPAADESRLDLLGDEILETLQSFYPVRSTEMGIHEYDHRFTDYSSGSVRNMIKKLTDYEQKLYRFRGATLSNEETVKFRLLQSNVDIALLELKRIAAHNRLPQLYIDEAIDGLYTLLNSQHAPMEQKVVPIMARMMAVPRLFETARDNIKRPPKLWVDEAHASLEPAIAFYRQVEEELVVWLPNRAGAIREASSAAREAMSGFAQWLSTVDTGNATSFAIGVDDFNYKLSHEYFLPYDADSLLKLGEAFYAEADSMYDEYKLYVAETQQTGNEPVFVPSCFSRSDVIDYHNWEVAQVRQFCFENEIVTIPQEIATVEVRETPDFMKSVITGIAYQPAGPFDEIQRGIFYIRPIPTELDSVQLAVRAKYIHRRGFKGSVVHEGYPGHHLQMQVAGMHPDPVRKWQRNFLAIEGWALYCEQMMYEAGLYGGEDPAMWLAILGGIRFRAARIIADVKLHTGQFTYDACVDWMNAALDSDTDSGREYIRNQVRLYTHRPTYQMSYLIGKLEILKLREEMIALEGENFSLQGFHDALLSEGSIPPALVRLAWEMELTE